MQHMGQNTKKLIHKRFEGVDGSAMQVGHFPLDDDGQVQHQFSSSTFPKLENVEYEQDTKKN
eukprot:12507214-Prorocentrum_lima.AAC.1